MITIIQEHLPQLLTGLLNTVFSSLIALIGSLILGTIFALFEISPNRLLRFIGKAYVEVFRNIPLLVIVLIFFILSFRCTL